MRTSMAWPRAAVPALCWILAGCAAPPPPAWLAGTPSPVHGGEGWEEGTGSPPFGEEPPSGPEGRKSILDPDAFLWRAGAGFWMPSLGGDGWYRGRSADGVDTEGTGAGFRLGVRHRYVKGPSADTAAYAPSPGTTEWPIYFGAEVESFSGRASDGGDSGSLGAVDLAFVFGTAHVPAGGKRPVLVAELLAGLRRASIDVEGDDLAAVGAEESLSKVGVLLGVNLEIPLGETVTVFGRLDGSLAGSSDSDEVRTLQAFAGIRAALGDHLSLEGGWRHYEVEATRRDTYYGTILFFIPYSETYKVQEATLRASGPWIGLVYDF